VHYFCLRVACLRWLDVVRKKLVSLGATYFFVFVVEVKFSRGLEPFSPNGDWQCGHYQTAQGKGWKTSTVGFFGFFGFFFGFLGFFAQTRGFLGFFKFHYYF
jgi:hypothetical protein